MRTPPSRLRYGLACAALALLGVGAAGAGTLYVPLAGVQSVEGVSYETRVWVSGTDNSERSFTAQFIPGDADGTTTRQDRGEQDVGVRGSVLFTGLAPDGALGLLELTGAKQLVVGAQLGGTGGGAAAAALPVISADNQFQPGKAADIQGFVKSPDEVSSLVIVNLGHTAASCNVLFRRANGSAVAAATPVAMPPLSQRSFADALGLLGQTAISGARATVSCNKPFYAFGVVFEPAEGEAHVLQPAESLASNLAPPGNTAGCPAGAVGCFIREGSFFTTTNDERHRYYVWAPDVVEFGRIEATFKFKLNRWDDNPNGIYTLLYLSRNGKVIPHAYAEVVPREKGKILTQVHANATQYKVVRGQLKPGQTYDVHYYYDAANRKFGLHVRNAQGATVAKFDEALVAPQETIDLRLGQRGGQAPYMAIQFSDPPQPGTDHVSMWGTWSDLVVAAYP